MPAQTKPIYLFLLFWSLTSIMQLFIAKSGSVSFEGFKDATIMVILWLIPVLLMPKYVEAGLLKTTIVDGGPYGKSLGLLKGTTHIKTSQHGVHLYD